LKPKTIIGGLAGLAILAVGGFAVWFFLLREDAPEAVSTDAALEQLTQRTPTSAAGESTPATAGQTPAPQGSAGIEGKWTVDTSLESFVGYRVQEELVGIGGVTAVGRTTGVTGGFSITGGKASAATITADMTKLKSQEALRDGQLRNQGIEYGRFPTAEFKLAETELPASLASGTTTKLSLKGSLTLHGVTREIEMPAEVTFKDGAIVVVGQLPIQFADYNISKPSSVRVTGMEDNGIVEVQLFFKKA